LPAVTLPGSGSQHLVLCGAHLSLCIVCYRQKEIKKNKLFAKTLEEFSQHNRNACFTKELDGHYSKGTCITGYACKPMKKTAIFHGDKI
jgi:hypothetical protein